MFLVFKDSAYNVTKANKINICINLEDDNWDIDCGITTNDNFYTQNIKWHNDLDFDEKYLEDIKIWFYSTFWEELNRCITQNQFIHFNAILIRIFSHIRYLLFTKERAMKD